MPDNALTALSTAETTLLQKVQSLQNQQVKWTQDLIAIPTVNPYSADASAGIEAAGQDWIEDKLKAMHAKVSRLSVPADVYNRAGIIGPAGRSWEGRQNIIAKWTIGNGQGPVILINDHMDTVGTQGMTIAPFDPQIKDGKIFGRGTSDTKGNLVVGLIAMQALLESVDDFARTNQNTQNALNGTIIFQSVVDEECSGAGAGTLACCLAGITGDFAIVLDGGGGNIVNGCNGIATASLVVQGKAGHNATGNSINAIDKAIMIKQATDDFAADHLATYPTCRTNIGVFRSGTQPSIVPDAAELQVNFSYDVNDAQKALDKTGHWSGSVFRNRFEQTIATQQSRDAWLKDHPAKIRWIKDMYPFYCEPTVPVIQLAKLTASAVAGRDIPILPMHAWFDASHFARQLDIPVIGFGHGEPGCAHAAVEYAELQQLWQGAKSLAVILARCLNQFPSH